MAIYIDGLFVIEYRKEGTEEWKKLELEENWLSHERDSDEGISMEISEHFYCTEGDDFDHSDYEFKAGDYWNNVVMAIHEHFQERRRAGW